MTYDPRLAAADEGTTEEPILAELDDDRAEAAIERPKLLIVEADNGEQYEDHQRLTYRAFLVPCDFNVDRYLARFREETGIPLRHLRDYSAEYHADTKENVDAFCDWLMRQSPASVELDISNAVFEMGLDF